MVRSPRNEQVKGSIPLGGSTLTSANAFVRYVPTITNCRFCHIRRCGGLHFAPRLILLANVAPVGSALGPGAANWIPGPGSGHGQSWVKERGCGSERLVDVAIGEAGVVSCYSRIAWAPGGIRNGELVGQLQAPAIGLGTQRAGERAGVDDGGTSEGR